MANEPVNGEKVSEPAVLEGPKLWEEELKDYSRPPDENNTNNSPFLNPEPAPAQKGNEN